jgi:hypothetical protein
MRGTLNPPNILIVGLGKVGMTYDFNAPNDQVLTHLRAIILWSKQTNTNINLFGVDINPNTREPFLNSFNSSQWSSNLDLIDSNTRFDLAVIATPITTIALDALRASRVLKINKYVIEKPAARNLVELNELAALPFANDDLIVGFPRPSLPSSLSLRKLIDSYGKEEVWRVEIRYGGSVLNILSHFLNLIEFIFEPIELSTFSFTKSKFLRASFKSSSGRILVETFQYSDKNDENNSMHIVGPRKISYTNSGRRIYAEAPLGIGEGDLTQVNFEKEISQMIGKFAEGYLNWAINGKECQFTRLTSLTLHETIRLAELTNYG